MYASTNDGVRVAFVLVGGGDLLDGNELGVARATIAHAGGVGFGRLSPAEGESALAVRRPRAVIVADDSLGFALAKCDVVDGHSAPPKCGLGLNPPHKPSGCGRGLF